MYVEYGPLDIVQTGILAVRYTQFNARQLRDTDAAALQEVIGDSGVALRRRREESGNER